MKGGRFASVLFSIMMLLLLVQGVRGTPEGIDYSLGPQGFEMTNGAFSLSLTGNQGPHYIFFDNLENETEYHLKMIRVFEYLDDNHDDVYTAADTAINPSTSLQTSTWSFGGFVSEQSSGEISTLQFNLSSIGGFSPHQPQLNIEIQNQITVQNANALKFGITLEGWSWSRGDSNLAIVMALGSGGRGQQMQRPSVSHSSGNLTFGNGFFSYASDIQYGTNQAQLNASLGGAMPQGEGEQFFLCFPHFGDETLECDPLLGLIQGSVIPTTTTTTSSQLLDTERFLLVAGGVTVVLLILVLINSRRN
jgi:hypothetical protein